MTGKELAQVTSDTIAVGHELEVETEVGKKVSGTVTDIREDVIEIRDSDGHRFALKTDGKVWWILWHRGSW